MSLLAGIVGSGLRNLVSTTVTAESGAITGSGSFTVPAGSAGQLIVAIHTAFKLNGTISAPATPSGYTSLASYSASGSYFSSRISYKILTITEASMTFPSVTNAEASTGITYAFTPASGTFTGVSLAQQSGFTYLSSGTWTNSSVSAVADSICIGVASVYNDNIGFSLASFPQPRDTENVAAITDSINNLYILSVSAGKVYTSPTEVLFGATASSANPSLTNLIRLTPTLS